MLIEGTNAAPNDGMAMKTFRRGPNKHIKKTAMVTRFNEVPLPDEKPVVLVLGQSDLVGTDLQHVDVIISFGLLEEEDEKQLAGRGLRMSRHLARQG